MQNDMVIYQAKSGALELRQDLEKETIWATQGEMARIFGVNPQAVTRHLQHIYKEKELSKKATCSKMEQVQIEGKRRVRRTVEAYNLDAIIAVGYRINSVVGTKFRQWATKMLRQHITDGYTINKARIVSHYQQFIEATKNTKGTTKKRVELTAETLAASLAELKVMLTQKGEATELFGAERAAGSVVGIVGNVMQSFGGKDLYETAEEKAAHLLYFIVKNHPFTDGNKRNGAYAFVWFLHQARILDTKRLTPPALTALTILVAESNPRDKEKIIHLVLTLLLGAKK